MWHKLPFLPTNCRRKKSRAGPLHVFACVNSTASCRYNQTRRRLGRIAPQTCLGQKRGFNSTLSGSGHKLFTSDGHNPHRARRHPNGEL
jgi:hypothetical protein